MTKPVFITTSIAYVNAPPHIGHLFELLSADVLKRAYVQAGQSAFLLTGTDEHGSKVAQAAEAAGQTPQAYADQISAKFRELGADFGIDFDWFIRTTDPAHIAFVQEKWQQLQAAGVLEKRRYQGLYCKGCEAFKTERELKYGKCLIHETPAENVEEENWFLIIGDEQKKKIAAWVKESVHPVSRQSEILNMLADIDSVSVSRNREQLSWGVPVPGDATQIMYVWVDALLNYLSALKINSREELWPADIQIVGKDIIKFHAVIWPTLLLTLGYELPKKLLIHGFINVDGKKMSKSLGNVVTPLELKTRYGAEATRYLLLRHLPFYDDSNFSWADFDELYDGELANGLGNLLARVIGLAKRWTKTLQPSNNETTNSWLEGADFAGELKAINDLINQADVWISEQKPWGWTDGSRLDELIKAANLWEIAERLTPFMPETAKEILHQLSRLDSKPLFPRLEK